jgi:hypothetical protein
MKRTIKSLMARWIARRIEIRTRQLRRSFRDQQRAVRARIRSADHRALGLRLYAAWSTPKAEPIGDRPSLLLAPSLMQQTPPDLRIYQLVDYNA